MNNEDKVENESNVYQNSKLVDYNIWSNHKKVVELVMSLKGIIDSRKYKDYLVNIRVIIVNLYYAYIVDPYIYTSYFGNRNKYRFIHRYNPNKLITSDYFIGAIEMLAAQGYIEKKRGGHFMDEITKEYYGYTNKMKASQKLIDLFISFRLTPDMIEKYDYTSELIRMKDKPYYREYINKNGKKAKVKIKDPCDFVDNRYTISLEKSVYEYNRLLNATYIDIDVECTSDEDNQALVNKAKTRRFRKRSNNTTLDLSQKNVYRVFNNKSFKYGGRYYGAWWMGCPSELRKYIYINGEPTAELDYSGMHIHLLYALRGYNYATFKQDAYSLKNNDPERNLNKLILLTAINADTEQAAVNSTYRQLLDSNELTKYDLIDKPKLKIKSLLTQLKQKHTLIKDDIASGKGIELQNYDSNIIAMLLSHFTKLNIPILTVHDYVICQAKYANFIKDKMWQFYYDILANKDKLGVNYQSINPHNEVLLRKQHYNKDKIISPGVNTMLYYSIKILNINNYKSVRVSYPESVIVIKSRSNLTKCTGRCQYVIRLNEHKVSKTNINYVSIGLSKLLGLV